MDYNIECRKCHCNLEQWNVEEYAWINYCPNCGTKLLEKQVRLLHDKTTEAEIDDKIRGSLLDLFDNYDCYDEGIEIDELAHKAWESENVDGVVFYSNYRADKFVQRHGKWVDEALDYINGEFGDPDYYTQMKISCNDRFLVVAFIEATNKYLYGQLGLDLNEGKLTKKRIAELKKQVKNTPYSAEW